MCGIIVLAGPCAVVRLPDCLNRLRHRGPDGIGTRIDSEVAMGFTRLAVNGGTTAGCQPLQYGDMTGVINGEIYNHQELEAIYGLKPSDCDTDVFLSVLAMDGERCIDKFDGFYSAVVHRSSSRELLCFRDHIGKKPLFVGRSLSELFISSELKAVEDCDWFELLPRGVSSVNLDTYEVKRIASHQPVLPQKSLVSAFEDAVHKRIPGQGQRVGVFLSGGLDSSLVAAYVSRARADAVYFTLGEEGSPDHFAVKSVVDMLGINDLRVVPLPQPEMIPALIRQVVFVTESYNPSIVSNGLATYLLAEAAHAAGIKVVLTGEGADELFGGYHLFDERGPWSEVREQLIIDMQTTELRRLDMSCMANSIEPRCPFLDRSVRAISESLGFHDLYNGKVNKLFLRQSFASILPPEIINRKKTSFDVGSGIRGKVVRYLQRNGRRERDELRRLWADLFTYDHSQPYFHAYPVFDAVIDRRGEVHR